MFEASFLLSLSSKDKQKLVVSGHEYYLKRKNKTNINWICAKYQTHNCRATAITDEENFIEMRGEINHKISTGKLDARLVSKTSGIWAMVIPQQSQSQPPFSPLQTTLPLK